MNAKDTLKEVKKEKQRIKKLLKESSQHCQELLWAMEEDAPYGQEKMDGDEARKITLTLSCAEKVIGN